MAPSTSETTKFAHVRTSSRQKIVSKQFLSMKNEIIQTTPLHLSWGKVGMPLPSVNQKLFTPE